MQRMADTATAASVAAGAGTAVVHQIFGFSLETWVALGAMAAIISALASVVFNYLNYRINKK